MRVAVPHNLPREEVQRRMRSSTHEIADHIPGGMAKVRTDWASDDVMNIIVSAMGQDLRGTVTIEDRELVIDIAMPLALGFIEPVIAGAIRKQSTRMLEAPTQDRP